jgi:hypothetical protein
MAAMQPEPWLRALITNNNKGGGFGGKQAPPLLSKFDHTFTYAGNLHKIIYVIFIETVSSQNYFYV